MAPPVEPGSETVLHRFETQVRNHPDRIAVTEGSNQISYSQLNARAEAIARKIRQASGNNSSVAILLPQGIEFISSVYGTFKSSRTVAPIDIGNSKTQIAFILEELNNPLLITSKELFAKVPDYKNVMTVTDRDLAENQSLPENVEQETLVPTTKLAFIVFTSGSTGKPKGVMISHRVIFAVTNTTWSRNEISATDRAVTYSSPAFVLSFSEYITTLVRGGSIFVPPTECRQNLDKLHAFVIEHQITLLSMPTSAGVKMMEKDMPSLRWLRIGGEKLTVPIQGTRSYRILYVYGASEAFSMAYRVSFEDSGVPNNGLVAPGATIWLLDENLEEVGPGEVGEICVTSETIADGYLNHPELTKERFVPNPFNPAQILFRTGDLGYFNAAKELVVTGRADFQVKIMGHRLELGQIEFALSQHPNIKQAAVILRESTSGNPTIAAFCVPQTGTTIPDYNALCTFLTDHLPTYAFPSQVVGLDTIPLTTSGKFDRQALKRIRVDKVVEPLNTETERKLGAIWADVLKIPVEEIGRADSFSRLGGNSLQLALVVTKLQTAPWFLDVRLRHLIQVPRLDEFSALIDKSRAGSFVFSELGDEGEKPDFGSDLQLDSKFPKVITNFKSVEQQDILLTGTTGYVGANFLQAILENAPPAHRIYCLVRAESNGDAQKRLHKTLGKFGIEIKERVLQQQVVCLSGDVSKHNFGMTQSQYSALCQSIDVVYHFAAEVHFVKTYNQLQESNVGGTRRMLNFCVETKIKFFHFISTFGAIGNGCEDETILEIPDPLFQIDEEKSRDMGYSQTKRVSEKLVWSAIQRGLPAIVYRLGEIGSHSKLNVVNRDDFLARLFITCQETGFYPMMGDKKLPYGSVDFTCEAILAVASQQRKWQGKCFHVFENQISYSHGLGQLKNVVSLERGAWVTKIGQVIDSETDPTRQEEFSILLQLMHNTTSSSVLDKTFSNSNLEQALLGSEVKFIPTQDWSRYLDVLFNLNN